MKLMKRRRLERSTIVGGVGIMVMMDGKESGLKLRGISLLFCILSNGASIHMLVLLLPSPFPRNLFFSTRKPFQFSSRKVFFPI